jgi:hypothetical protein
MAALYYYCLSGCLWKMARLRVLIRAERKFLQTAVTVFPETHAQVQELGKKLVAAREEFSPGSASK